MTESEWLAAQDIESMMNFARSGRRLSARVFRLFACACCRRVWHLLQDERGRAAVEAAEAFAEGRIKQGVMLAAELEAESVFYASQDEMRKFNAATGGDAWTPSEPASRLAAIEAACVVSMADLGMVALTSGLVANAVARVAREPGDAVELRAHAGLLRDIGDNLFFGVKLKKVWLTDDVRGLAAAAYQNRVLPRGELEPARLSMLADALEDAGCTSGVLLEHLRSPGPHIRGCWALQLVLGRK